MSENKPITSTVKHPHCAAIVLAAGCGSRMVANQNKAFMDINGKPMFSYSLQCFRPLSWVQQLLLVVSQDDVESIRQQFSKELEGVTLVTGGARRQDSVWEGLQQVKEGMDWVLVHDAARPMIRTQEVETLASTFSSTTAQGAILGVPVADNLKSMKSADSLYDIYKGSGSQDENSPIKAEILRELIGDISITLDIKGVYAAQTPQLFSLPTLLESYEHLRSVGDEARDDSQVVENKGFSVIVVKGRTDNFKVTFPEDLDIARLTLKNR